MIATTCSRTPYSEIVVHCINVSLQEQQKKLAMYLKRIEKKAGLKAKIESSCGLYTPDFQYMNIYQNQKPRLSCFRNIKLEDTYDEFDQENILYNHCDASSYENYLDTFCKLV